MRVDDRDHQFRALLALAPSLALREAAIDGRPALLVAHMRDAAALDALSDALRRLERGGRFTAQSADQGAARRPAIFLASDAALDDPAFIDALETAQSGPSVVAMLDTIRLPFGVRSRAIDARASGAGRTLAEAVRAALSPRSGARSPLHAVAPQDALTLAQRRKSQIQAYDGAVLLFTALFAIAPALSLPAFHAQILSAVNDRIARAPVHDGEALQIFGLALGFSFVFMSLALLAIYVTETIWARGGFVALLTPYDRRAHMLGLLARTALAAVIAVAWSVLMRAVLGDQVDALLLPWTLIFMMSYLLMTPVGALRWAYASLRERMARKTLFRHHL